MTIRLADIVDTSIGGSVEILPLESGGDEWLAYLMQDDNADICHHPAWGKIFRDSLGLESALVVHRSEGQIDGGVPLVIFDQWLTGKAMISMPFLNYGGILYRSESAGAEILKACRTLLAQTRAGYLELRHAGRGIGDLADRTVENRVAFRLDTNRPAQNIFDAFKKQLRTRIRKSEHQGLDSYQGNDRLDDFYTLFAMAMAEHGTPVLPKRFFQAILTHLPEYAQIVLAYKDGRPVGGKLVMTFKKRATMTWGCYPDRHKDLLANYLLTWELIQRLAGSPVTTLDFGRSPRGGGGYIYKSNWGPEEIPIFVDYLAANLSKIPNLKPDNPKFQLPISLWKRLPLGVTRLVGPRLARYFP